MERRRHWRLLANTLLIFHWTLHDLYFISIPPLVNILEKILDLVLVMIVSCYAIPLVYCFLDSITPSILGPAKSVCCLHSLQCLNSLNYFIIKQQGLRDHTAGAESASKVIFQIISFTANNTTAEPAYSRLQGNEECCLLKEKSIIAGVE